MEDFGGLFKLMPLILVVGFFVTMIIVSSNREKRAKEMEVKKKAENKQAVAMAINAEIETANQAAEMLPDIESALNLLREKYGWPELTETIGVYARHLELLNQLTPSQTHHLSLPSMQADEYGENERRVINRIRTKMPQAEDINFWGYDVYAQEPTAEMLRELVWRGYVVTAEPFTKNSRNFDCKLTSEGVALMELERLFYRGYSATLNLRRAPSSDAKKVVASFMYRCTEQLKIQTQEQKE